MYSFQMFTFMCFCVCMSIYVSHMASDALVLELQVVVNCHMGARNQPWGHTQNQQLLSAMKPCLQPLTTVFLRKKITKSRFLRRINVMYN